VLLSRYRLDSMRYFNDFQNMIKINAEDSTLKSLLGLSELQDSNKIAREK